jgi:hypothetical protein
VGGVAEGLVRRRADLGERQSDVEVEQVLAVRLVLAQAPEFLGTAVPQGDPHLDVDHDHPGPQRGEDRFEEVVHLVEFESAVPQRLVHGLQLVVGGVRFLVDGLPFLHGGLEHPVGRLQFLVGRLELLVSRLQLAVGVLELGIQPLGPADVVEYHRDADQAAVLPQQRVEVHHQPDDLAGTEVQAAEGLRLRLRVEIHQGVAADQQVDPGDRRVQP